MKHLKTQFAIMIVISAAVCGALTRSPNAAALSFGIALLICFIAACAAWFTAGRSHSPIFPSILSGASILASIPASACIISALGVKYPAFPGAMLTTFSIAAAVLLALSIGIQLKLAAGSSLFFERIGRLVLDFVVPTRLLAVESERRRLFTADEASEERRKINMIAGSTGSLDSNGHILRWIFAIDIIMLVYIIAAVAIMAASRGMDASLIPDLRVIVICATLLHAVKAAIAAAFYRMCSFRLEKYESIQREIQRNTKVPKKQGYRKQIK